MVVFPLTRSVGLKAATASSRAATLPMFVLSRHGPVLGPRRKPLAHGFHLAHPWAMNPTPRIIRIGMRTPSKRSVTIRNSSKVGHRGGSRCCTIHLDHPSIAITRAYQRARNNWNFDPQGIERSTNAGGMDSLDTCNPSFHLNHVWGFQLRSITHISHSGADLKRQCELGDVYVIIDITLTP